MPIDFSKFCPELRDLAIYMATRWWLIARKRGLDMDKELIPEAQELAKQDLIEQIQKL